MKTTTATTGNGEERESVIEATRKFANGLLSSGMHPQDVVQVLVYIAVDLSLHTDNSNQVLPSVLLSICAAASDYRKQQAKLTVGGLDHDELSVLGSVIH